MQLTISNDDFVWWLSICFVQRSEDFSASWCTGNEWRVTEAWSPAGYLSGELSEHDHLWVTDDSSSAAIYFLHTERFGTRGSREHVIITFAFNRHLHIWRNCWNSTWHYQIYYMPYTSIVQSQNVEQWVSLYLNYLPLMFVSAKQI
jgi:hypothetical protein